MFSFKKGEEHCGLKISQVKRLENPDYYVYSKNIPGGLMQASFEQKVVTNVANPTVAEWCHVAILDKYLKKLPPAAIEKDLFYCKPMPTVPVGDLSAWWLWEKTHCHKR